MGAPRSGLNPTTLSTGFTAKLVTVRSVSADGSTAIVVDRQNTQTQVPMLVQRSKGPLPAPGDSWLIAQDLGMWTFAAFVAASESDFAGAGSGGSQAVVAPTAPAARSGIWFNSADGNQLAAWSGAAWAPALFGAAAIAPGSLTAAQLAAAAGIRGSQLAAAAGITAAQVGFTASQIGGSRVFGGPAQPTGMALWDLWFDGSALSVWTGEDWYLLSLSASAPGGGSLPAVQVNVGQHFAGNIAAAENLTVTWAIPAGDGVTGTTYQLATFAGVTIGQNAAETLTIGARLNGAEVPLATLGASFNGSTLSATYDVPLELTVTVNSVGANTPQITLSGPLGNTSANRLATNSANLAGHSDTQRWNPSDENTLALYAAWGGTGGSIQRIETLSSRLTRSGP